MTTNTEAARAIARSISHDEIVIIEWSEVDTDHLKAAADDDVATDREHQYWGTTESGDEWRVHVAHPFAIGAEVEGGRGEDHDTGTLDAIEGNKAWVRWSSGVKTTAPLSLLSEV